MSALIYKPANVPIKKVLSYNPYYVAFAYADKNQEILIKKFKETNYEAWKELAKLTDTPVIIFCSRKRNKCYERNIENISPIVINKDIVYVAVGDLLDLNKKEKKKFSSALLLKDSIKPMVETMPTFFFTPEGQWLTRKFLTAKNTAMLFLNKAGEVSITHAKKGELIQDLWVYDNEKM